MRLRSCVQSLFFLLFVLFLFFAPQGFGLPSDFFLRFDPLCGLCTHLASRSFVQAFLPALVVLVSALIFGRIFCGWLCPMGALFDAFRAITGRRHSSLPVPDQLKYVRFVLLALMIAIALLGLNAVFLASPLPLTARLLIFVFFPFVDSGLEKFFLDAEPVAYNLNSQTFVAVFWCVLFLLELWFPRFWCRFLCPAGALLGLLGSFAPIRRRVHPDRCTSCGLCRGRCPADLCRKMPVDVSPSDCLVCGRCEMGCPKYALDFSHQRRERLRSGELHPSRRFFLVTLASGAVSLAGLEFLSPSELTEKYVRPPGSLPERDFLARCLRCAACIRSCPTGGLAAVIRADAASALFSPQLVPVSGPCKPDCTACGQVCPTSAILPLRSEEKNWARVGTAVIDQTKCLAWEKDRRCMVCMENCPYGAISVSLSVGHSVSVPRVRSECCFGCGFCEHTCPAEDCAIHVSAEGALRMKSAHFEERARALGLRLEVVGRGKKDSETIEEMNGPPPGFLP